MRCIESKESSQKNMQGPTIFTFSLRSYATQKKKIKPINWDEHQTQKFTWNPKNEMNIEPKN